MKSIVKNVLFFLVGVVLLTAFTYADNSNLLIRKWKPVKFVFNGEEKAEPENTDKSLEFFEDGTFIVDGDESGQWEYDESSAILKMTDTWDMTLKVEKLSKKELIISTEKDGQIMKAFMIAVD